jgi:hypothetical protein
MYEPEEIKNAQDLLKSNNKNLTLTFSYLTDKGIEKMLRILEKIDLNQDNLEMVVNDWGAFYYLKKQLPKAEIVIGRLLNKIKRDPRIDKVMQILDKDVAEFCKSSNLLTYNSLQFLKKQNINKIEFDYPLQGLDLKKTSLQYFVHYPYGYITTTRFCIQNPQTWKINQEFNCSTYYCKSSILQMKCKNFFMDVYQKGNTIFYYNKKITLDELKDAGFHRVIEHPDFMRIRGE